MPKHVMPMPPASMCALKFLTGMEATCMDRGATNENVSIYTYVHTIVKTNYSKYIYIAIKYIYYYYNIEERNLKLLDSTKLLDFAKLLDARLFFFLLF